MKDLTQKIYDIGIIPVIKIEDANTAVPLAKALMAGGIYCAEVTFRTAAAEQAIRNIKQSCPDMLVGAGTVLTTEQANIAIAAGAQFIVAPGFNRNVVTCVLSQNVPMVPGCITPTEIEMALECGIDVIKFFPAEQAGGLAMIKALSAPYGNVRFVPTGGIGLGNLATYLQNKKIIACGGSFMVTDDLEQVTELSKQAIKIVRSVRDE